MRAWRGHPAAIAAEQQETILMLQVRYSLSACYAGISEIVASGETAAGDLGAVAGWVLERHRDEISTVGGMIDLDGELVPWCIELWDPEPLAGALIIGSAETVQVPVACWTACPDRPGASTPEVRLALQLAATPPPPGVTHSVAPALAA